MVEKNEHRVKYFPPSDMAFGWGIEKIEELHSNKYKLVVQDVNDAIEFYNFYLYFHNEDLKWSIWPEDRVSEFKNFSEELKLLAFKFFGQLDDSSICSELSNLYFEYNDDFIYLFEKTKLYKKISNITFNEIFETNKLHLYNILENKNLTDYFGEEIVSILLNLEEGGEYIIKAADSENNEIDTKIYIPKCLTVENKNTILENYLNSPSINLNYVNLLLDIPLYKSLSPILVKKYIQKKNELENQILQNSKQMYSISVSFIENQKDLVKVEILSGGIKTTYSKDWILDNLCDYPTLLNNFIYMFEYADESMRIILPSININSGLINVLCSSNNSKIYNINPVAQKLEFQRILSMQSFYELLLSKNVLLEKVFSWFFSEYLVNEFEVPLFKTHISLDSRSYLEKCHELVTNIDVICKQFYSYKEFGEISFDLLKINSKNVTFQDIPSLLNNKYVYGCGRDFNMLCYYLFSDQCLLSYVPRIKKSYKSFLELLLKEEIYKSDYNDRDKNILDTLKQWEVIDFDNNNQILLKNMIRINILKELYTMGFLNFHRYPQNYKDEIYFLKTKNCVCFKDTLLSNDEANYFNYYLNDVYSNGPKLRNLYAHGIEYLNDNEDSHYSNYIVLLRLMVLLIIKINDEFCLKDVKSINNC